MEFNLGYLKCFKIDKYSKNTITFDQLYFYILLNDFHFFIYLMRILSPKGIFISIKSVYVANIKVSIVFI